MSLEVCLLYQLHHDSNMCLAKEIRKSISLALKIFQVCGMEIANLSYFSKDHK